MSLDSPDPAGIINPPNCGGQIPPGRGDCFGKIQRGTCSLLVNHEGAKCTGNNADPLANMDAAVAWIELKRNPPMPTIQSPQMGAPGYQPEVRF